MARSSSRSAPKPAPIVPDSTGAVRLVATINEAAVALAVSGRHVRRLIATGELGAKRAGRRVLIPWTELHRYLDVLPSAMR